MTLILNKDCIKYEAIITENIKENLSLRKLHRIGNSMRAKNSKYKITAGIPIVQAICKGSQ